MLLCIPANLYVHPGLVHKGFKSCVSSSLGFEKEISKQMEKDIFPVSASCFLLAPYGETRGCGRVTPLCPCCCSSQQRHPNPSEMGFFGS